MYIIHQETRAISATESLVGVITYDSAPLNPVEHCDLLGTMAVHPKDAHWAHEAIDLNIPMGNNPFEHMDNFIKAKGYKPSEVIAYPITKYEHGDISLSLGDNRTCRFDSGIIGFIYAEKEKIRKEFGIKRITKDIVEKVTKIFADELKTQSDYLNGKVFAFQIYQVDTAEFEKYGKHCLEKSECIDSCYGAINDMTDMLECMAKKAA